MINLTDFKIQNQTFPLIYLIFLLSELVVLVMFCVRMFKIIKKDDDTNMDSKAVMYIIVIIVNAVLYLSGMYHFISGNNFDIKKVTVSSVEMTADGVPVNNRMPDISSGELNISYILSFNETDATIELHNDDFLLYGTEVYLVTLKDGTAVDYYRCDKYNYTGSRMD